MFKTFVQVFNTVMATRSMASRASATSQHKIPRPDRQLAILLAAEKLFAQRGYHGVTIRQIAEEAGVPLALVSYYHGAKHELFHAIFVHWHGTIEQRLSQLQEVSERQSKTPKGDRLRLVVEAFVGPVLAQRASAEGEYYAQLVGRELAHQTPETQRVLTEFFDPLAHRFIDALHAVRPDHDRGLAAWAYQFALGALLHHIGDHRITTLSRGQYPPADRTGGELLINFITAGINAVLPLVRSPRASTSTTRRQEA